MTASSTICVETALQPLYIAAPQTSRIAPHCVRIAGKREVTGSAVGFVPTNALVLTGLANFRVVGKSEVIQDWRPKLTHYPTSAVNARYSNGANRETNEGPNWDCE